MAVLSVTPKQVLSRKVSIPTGRQLINQKELTLSIWQWDEQKKTLMSFLGINIL